MSRQQAIASVHETLDSGALFDTLARRIAIASESQDPGRAAELERYLRDEMIPSFEAMGFSCRVLEHPKALAPFLVAERFEDAALPTVLGYGHGDVIRGLEPQWRAGLNPWRLHEEGDRLYGRGTADNKGQHTINLGALQSVLAVRGKLGFNVKLLIETGEEIGIKRLEARPVATLTIEAQERRERRERQYGDRDDRYR